MKTKGGRSEKRPMNGGLDHFDTALERTYVRRAGIRLDLSKSSE
jgi:hypothetical protein